jgi:hypothetical protein
MRTRCWSHLMRIDVKNNFRILLGFLGATQPAFLIQLADSHDNLANRLYRFTSAWSEQATFPATLKPYCSSLLEKVADKASDLDIWTAVATLLVAFDSLRVTPRSSKENNATFLKKDWTSTFIGDSLRILQGVIRDFECQPLHKRDEFYARTLVFLQSSGMGKSRLADAFGQGCPMINYVLREK